MTKVRVVRPGTPPKLTVRELRRLGKSGNKSVKELVDAARARGQREGARAMAKVFIRAYYDLHSGDAAAAGSALDMVIAGMEKLLAEKEDD